MSGKPSPVASATACHGQSAPYSNIFDLSGNVDEWEDTCVINTGIGRQDLCRIRGGYYGRFAIDLRCDADWGLDRDGFTVDVGIRCCAP